MPTAEPLRHPYRVGCPGFLKNMLALLALAVLSHEVGYAVRSPLTAGGISQEISSRTRSRAARTDGV